VASRGVQQDLLAYWDGTFCGKTGLLDSSRILNVACGAFVGLEDFRKRRSDTPQIGFLPGNDVADTAEALEPLSTQHLIDYGLIPEFIGRFSSVTELLPLDASTLRRILTDAEGNPLSVKKRLYEIHGIDLRIADCALDEMIALAAAMGTGARGLKRVLQSTLSRYDSQLPELAAQGGTTLTITAATVRGEEPGHLTIAPSRKDLLQLTELRKHAGAYSVWRKRPKEESVW
jgi:ATP-dependent Clp protease ATP-binding subunit ClpX